MIEHWRQTLATRAAEWGLPQGGEWNVLLHNNYQPAGSTMNLLWFHRKEPFPRVVTKMCRNQSILAQEFRNLETVYRVAPRYVPRPMHFGAADGFGMLWMGGVPGRRIPPGRQYSASMLAGLVDMLLSIHDGVNKGTGTSSPGRHERMVASPVEALLRYTTSAAVREGCGALLEVATAEWLEKLPVIPQHADLFLDNILRHREECHIVDWENFGAIDLPFHDLLTLLLSFLWASAIAPEQWDRGLGEEIPRLIERYARGLQLPVSAAATMLPITLVNRFYLHWAEGRTAAGVMYAAVEHYFKNPRLWREIFLGG